jgi:hypothetical protein
LPLSSNFGWLPLPSELSVSRLNGTCASRAITMALAASIGSLMLVVMSI